MSLHHQLTLCLCVVSADSANIKLRAICPVWVHNRGDKVLDAAETAAFRSAHTDNANNMLEDQWLCGPGATQWPPLLINACLNRFASQVN